MASDSLVPACHIVTPVGMLSFGLDEDQTAAVLDELTATGVPTALILDSGSTDGGPQKLALGDYSSPRSSYYRDLKKLLRLVDRFHVPLAFSSAGGDGSDAHVKDMLQIVEEISAEPENEHYSLKTVAIYSEVSKSLVISRLQSVAISGCGPAVPPLTLEDIGHTPCIVAQAGPEPFLAAMKANPDFNVIIGGRAYDPALYIAYAAWKTGTDFTDTRSPKAKRLWGGFTHMGKIMECGGLCAEPKSPGAVATVYTDGTFDIVPLDPKAKCTPLSVASHTLYEKTRPDILSGPGGYLNLTDATYEQLRDGRIVRMRGGTFHFLRDQGQPYQLKLEGARVTGYRAMIMGSIRSPILIRQLDSFLSFVKEYVVKQHTDHSGKWDLDWQIYRGSDEVFLIGEALADSQNLANSVASTTRVATVHGPYPGQKATSGNLAFGIGGKSTIELGPCANFTLYHLMDVKDGEEGLSFGDESNCGLPTSEGGRPLFRQRLVHIGQDAVAPEPRTPPKSNGLAKGVRLSLRSCDTATKTASTNGESFLEPPSTLSSISKVMRSKNAGPYEITFDVMFSTEEVYRIVKDSGLLTRSLISGLYKIPESDVIWIGFFDQARAFKATIPRMRKGKKAANGGFLENDVHGSQQYMPLAEVKLTEEMVRKVNEAWALETGNGKM